MNWGKRLLVLGREDDVLYGCMRARVFARARIFFQRTCVQVRNFGSGGSAYGELLDEGAP